MIIVGIGTVRNVTFYKLLQLFTFILYLYSLCFEFWQLQSSIQTVSYPFICLCLMSCCCCCAFLRSHVSSSLCSALSSSALAEGLQ